MTWQKMVRENFWILHLPNLDIEVGQPYAATGNDHRWVARCARLHRSEIEWELRVDSLEDAQKKAVNIVYNILERNIEALKREC